MSIFVLACASCRMANAIRVAPPSAPIILTDPRRNEERPMGEPENQRQFHHRVPHSAFHARKPASPSGPEGRGQEQGTRGQSSRRAGDHYGQEKIGSNQR